ncbi:MAG: hypothetical protein AAGU21_10205 [Solidesulfovibrio sp.]|uniref:hypothetical protein n=1 Tax=Solidesulfovibrio sp. TaxID=2910990 RepID=UPI003158CD23
MTDDEKRFRHREFWLWEFARRNEQYQRDYDAFVQVWRQYTSAKNYIPEAIYAVLLSIKGIADLGFVDNQKADRVNRFVDEVSAEIEIFVDKHKRLPKDYKNGFNAEEMLKRLLENDEGMFDSYVDFELHAVATPSLEVKDSKVAVVIDTNMKIEQVINEVSFIYYNNKYQDPMKAIAKDVTDSLIACKRYEINELGKRIRSANLPRSCGTWMFDHMARDNELSEKEVVIKFIEKYAADISDKLGVRSMDDERRCLNLLKKIKESVEKIQYLSVV